MRRFLAAAIAATAFACTEPEAFGTADLGGTVVEGPAAGRVLIEGAYTNDPRDMIVRFSVTIDGPVFAEQENGDLQVVPASSIRVGDRLSVWTTGVVLKSFPPQVTSRRILVKRSTR